MKNREKSSILGDPFWQMSTGKKIHTGPKTRDEILGKFGDSVRTIMRGSPESGRKPSEYFEREKVALRKRRDGEACRKARDCAEVTGSGVRYLEGWLCRSCWRSEMSRRKGRNERRRLSKGDSGFVPSYPWPKQTFRIENLHVIDFNFGRFDGLRDAENYYAGRMGAEKDQN